MRIRTFDTFDKARSFAEKHSKEVMLFSLENGQQDFQWKPIGIQSEPIDLLAWIQDERKNTIFENAEDFIDFSEGQDVSEIVEEFKKHPNGFIVHDDANDYAYVEPRRCVMRWNDDGTTFAVGVEE